MTRSPVAGGDAVMGASEAGEGRGGLLQEDTNAGHFLPTLDSLGTAVCSPLSTASQRAGGAQHTLVYAGPWVLPESLPDLLRFPETGAGLVPRSSKRQGPPSDSPLLPIPRPIGA